MSIAKLTKAMGRVFTGLLLLGGWFCAIEAQPMAYIPQQQFPPGISWKILRGTHYNLLYAAELSDRAPVILALLEKEHARITADYQMSFPPITIVLNHQEASANGYVSLAPWKSMFYLFPPTEPELSGSDWITMLALHEARHMVQLGAARRSTIKLLWLLAGEQGWAFGLLGSTPLWYIEGDAVVFETQMTPGGRGRSPRFSRQTRALWLAGEEPSYSQAFLKSYKHFYPDHYELGYLLSRHLRVRYGAAAGADSLRYTTEFPHPWRFSGGLEEVTDKDIDAFYLEAMAAYRHIWRRQQENLTPTPFEKRREPDTAWLSYDHPQYDGYGNLYAVRNGFDHLPRLVRLDGRSDHEQAAPGYLYDNFVFVENDGSASWSEYRPHPRFFESSTAYWINSRRLTEKNKINIVRRVISPDGSSEASLVTQSDGTQLIEIVSRHQNRKLYTVEHGTAQLQSQRFCTTGRYLDYIVISDRGRSLWQLDLQNMQQKVLLPAADSAIADPHGNADSVYFSAPYSGLEAIWRLERNNGRLFQVIEHELGAFRPSLSPDSQRVAFNYHTRNGHAVGEADLTQVREIPQANVINREDGLADFARATDEITTIKAEKQDHQQPQEKIIPVWQESDYNHFTGVFNIHSWLPIFDISTRDIDVSLRSDNLLNSTGWNLGYIHNLNEKTHYGYGALQYAGLWPIFTVTAGYGSRATRAIDSAGKFFLLTWDESIAGLDMTLPLTWWFGHWKSAFTGILGIRQIRLHWQNNQVPTLNDQPAIDGSILPGAAEIKYALTRRMARRELQPRWGMDSSALFQTNLSDQQSAYQQAYSSILYFPGFFLNHGFALSGSLDHQGGNTNYLFQSYRRFARGYTAVIASVASHVSGDYILPLLYPDLNLLHLLYLRRLKTNFFFDRSVLNRRFYYDSAGIELTADMIPFKLNLMELDLGLRWSRLFQGNQDNWEIFLRAVRVGTF